MTGIVIQTLGQAYWKHFPIALPPAGTFAGQVVVVTGGTSGLGLAAAAHFLDLGADEVVITSRDAGRAQRALAALEKRPRPGPSAAANGNSSEGGGGGKVRVVDLDMGRYASVAAFAHEVAELRRGRGGVDYVVLNAGVAGTDFALAAEGWEQNIQVNALSTALLAALLVPRMKAERRHRAAPAHLAIVTSGRHLEPDVQQWESWIAGKEGGILRHLNRPENWPSADAMYAATKLMVHLAVEELAKMALGPDGRPEVIVNTTCPGIVKSDLLRHYVDKGRLLAIGVSVFTRLFAKSTSDGARTYVAVGLTKESEHGKFIRFYGSEAEYQRQAKAILGSKAGRRVQAQVWSEMTADFVAKVPEAMETLAS
ncbi:NAD(P)-binding protein [Durotheca rogersii]|uniref:NAD(P)-binding protein n=1 Tax=Durotheca rogersii TaxID=419775 RepID=UPI00221E8AB2|nr:NAD(P)-binding protein [Durotheca rogersii]KAI5863454.1 NAD(P)-binding protein [Durotheca rogersii]